MTEEGHRPLQVIGLESQPHELGPVRIVPRALPSGADSLSWYSVPLPISRGLRA
jgi:hypothetical protein